MPWMYLCSSTKVVIVLHGFNGILGSGDEYKSLHIFDYFLIKSSSKLIPKNDLYSNNIFYTIILISTELRGWEYNGFGLFLFNFGVEGGWLIVLEDGETGRKTVIFIHIFFVHVILLPELDSMTYYSMLQVLMIVSFPVIMNNPGYSSDQTMHINALTWSTIFTNGSSAVLDWRSCRQIEPSSLTIKRII